MSENQVEKQERIFLNQIFKIDESKDFTYQGYISADKVFNGKAQKTKHFYLDDFDGNQYKLDSRSPILLSQFKECAEGGVVCVTKYKNEKGWQLFKVESFNLDDDKEEGF